LRVSKPGWDLTSIRSLEAACEWLRKGAGAQLVIVVRPGDVAFALDPGIKPADAVTMVEVAMPDGMRDMEERRLQAKVSKKDKLKQSLEDAKWEEMRRERGL
jgi:hypothetical protein